MVNATRAQRFRYEEWSWNDGELMFVYSLDDRRFTERVRIEDAPARIVPSLTAAARLIFLLSGISYFKAGAPPVIDLGRHAVSDIERDFLKTYYVQGLGEFAHKNGLLSELQSLEIVGPSRTPAPAPVTVGNPPRQLVPFGGGIDSIVVVENTRRLDQDLALFVASRPGYRFAAIENAAAVTGLPIRRAERELDPQILRSKELGFLNGHVPVTGVLSAIAVLAALVDDRDTVVMSNEWSASSSTIDAGGIQVNHQWSKSLEFEESFRRVLAENIEGFQYYSALRPYSELWVADRFAQLERYHLTFRSCNKAFYLDPSMRLDHWCGECDKCCFINLILAPFLDRHRLERIFGGREPLTNPALEPKFRSLLGDPLYAKPFECVGDVDECRVAVSLAADRADRRDTPLLQLLAADISAEAQLPPLDQMLRPLSRSFIPDLNVQSALLD